MVRSRLLDRGREYIELYPQVTVTNKRGEKVIVSGTTPIRKRVNVTAERQAVSELNGQVVQKSVRVSLRLERDEIGPWSRIHLRGEDWDLSAPPHYSSGVSRATEHTQLILRSRNSLGSAMRPDPGAQGA